MGPVLEALEGLAESSIKAYNSLYDEPNSHHCYAQLEVSFTHNFVCVCVCECVCVYVGGWWGGGNACQVPHLKMSLQHFTMVTV